MNKLSFIFILSSLIFHLVLAQQADIQFEHYTTTDGLAGDNVFTILQDSNGFLWFGTFEGLSKFDGYTFTNYYNRQNDSTTISHKEIVSICENHDGKLWISTNRGGINLFDPLKETFQRIYQYPNDGLYPYRIVIDDSGKLWICTPEGLDHYDPETKQIKHFEYDADNNSSLSGKLVHLLYIDNKATLWVAAGSEDENTGGLNRYDPVSESFIRYSAKANDTYPLIYISTIAEDNKGNLFVGTVNNALHVYNREKDRFELILGNNRSHLPFAPIAKGNQFFTSLVTGLIQDKNGNYWVSTYGGGINFFDTNSGKMQHLLKNSQSNYSINSDGIHSIYEDKQGIIWVATNSGGVNKVIPSKSRFDQYTKNTELLLTLANYDVNTMLHDSSGKIWFGTNDGEIIVADSSSITQINLAERLKFIPGSIFAIFEDSQNRIWIGTLETGLIVYFPDSGKLRRYMPQEDNNGLTNPTVLSIGEDSKGILWIAVGEYKGVDRFDPARETFKNYHFDKSDKRSLSDNVVRKFFKDSENNFWLATAGGLNRYNKNNDNFDRFFPEINIRSVYEDSKGRFWITTHHDGLILFNRETGEHKKYTTTDGLLNNYTNNIIEDDNGYLWISSPIGFTRLDPEKMIFISFDKNDGIDNNFTRDVDAVAKLASGELIISGIKGITTFPPERIEINKYPPEVVIADFSVFNKSFMKNGLIDSVIHLDFDQNDLTFEYVALHFKNPSKNIYSTKLTPYENEWQKPNKLRHVRYTNLSAGQYTFYVKAASSDGVWNQQGKKLTIIINPPLWATWWAYTFYVLFALGLLYSVRRFELRRRLLQAENKRKSEELEEARQLQLSMLPKELPQLPHLDIAVYMQTATEVGGDYYDFHVSMDGTLTVVIGDATGHGMKAGTMVTSVKSLFNSHAANPDILFTFNEFSRCIRQMNFGRVSMCLSMLKIKDHSLQISTAAMPPSYIYRSKSKKVEEYPFEAMPLGAMDKFPYQQKETKLNPGDTILLLSDGLPELENKNGDMFGYSRIKNGFESVAEKSADNIISYLKNEGASWVNNGDPDDDVTFVVIKVKKDNVILNETK